MDTYCFPSTATAEPTSVTCWRQTQAQWGPGPWSCIQIRGDFITWQLHGLCITIFSVATVSSHFAIFSSHAHYTQPLFTNAVVYQVFEYHPSPWDQWLEVGNLQTGRYYHASLSIELQQISCPSGEEYNFNFFMLVWNIWSSSLEYEIKVTFWKYCRRLSALINFNLILFAFSFIVWNMKLSLLGLFFADVKLM